MAPTPTETLLDRLDEARKRFDSGAGGTVERLVRALARRRFIDPESLIRFHEMLLFLRAYPQSSRVLQQVDEILQRFKNRVDSVRKYSADIIAFDYIENSGIAGTAVTGNFSFGIVRWLSGRYPACTSITWDEQVKGDRLGRTLHRFMPLLYEDSLVEANIPYAEWLAQLANTPQRELAWLMTQLDRLDLTERAKAELYDSLELKVRWELDDLPSSRTHLRRPVRKVFYHQGDLIRRSDVSLGRELNAGHVRFARLSRARGQDAIDMLREATTVRYRELYGITNGDPSRVLHTSVGRGVEIFLWGLAPEKRLPLRAYHAGFTLKNGVPINYIEGISLFDRVEVGFNMFYTFRDGESAWIYAQVLRALTQVTGATCVSIDPYQLGHNNDEAIESGAFWFYRKLGFRPTVSKLAELTEREEIRIAKAPGYLTPAHVLRRLAVGNVVYEAPGVTPSGYWDGFHIRNIGFAIQRRMASRCGGDARRFRDHSRQTVSRALGLDASGFGANIQEAFDNLALVLALIPDLGRWTTDQKRLLLDIIHAKAGADEAEYLRLMQQHILLREAIRKIAVS
ncbi:MAG TPA: hypothetical protein VFV34_06670 [Blastocatellia bacterium]|nr:hypothetical protein [Blastocatellia bacterium]